MKIIARIFTDFNDKFGVPRQSGMVDELIGKIVFEREYRNPASLRGLDGFTHLWLIWGFSMLKDDEKKWRPTVRPPRLGGNKRVGVFATRSPYRPNPIGLSSVRLERIENTDDMGTVIYVSGIDMVNNTPIYDIKPYLPYVDSHPDATDGFAKDTMNYSLKVEIPNEYQSLLGDYKTKCLTKVLSNDPRPSYQNDSKRIYGMSFAGLEVKFRVDGDTLLVCDISKIAKE